jgi:hypothetical protein
LEFEAEPLARALVPGGRFVLSGIHDRHLDGQLKAWHALGTPDI